MEVGEEPHFLPGWGQGLKRRRREEYFVAQPTGFNDDRIRAFFEKDPAYHGDH
jgi:hypothetical protein